MSDLAPLARDLTQLTTHGGTDNRLIARSGPAWLLYSGRVGERIVRCEAAASAYLPTDQKLRPADVHLLRQAGFASRPGHRGLVREYRLGDGDGDHHTVKIADDATEILRSVYRADPAGAPVTHQLLLGDEDPTTNEPLIDAIRKLSKSRDTPTRDAMYRQMLRGRFLLPVDERGGPIAFGELQGFPVFGVFTDRAALRWWNPLDVRVEHMRGRQLFPLLSRTGLGSVLINPEGRIGGELYRNEVKMLADAVR
jgi:hypothetical protein